MKVYLDTTVLIAFLFGELSDVELEKNLLDSPRFMVYNVINSGLGQGG
jgi:hypothetical protein